MQRFDYGVPSYEAGWRVILDRQPEMVFLRRGVAAARQAADAREIAGQGFRFGLAGGVVAVVYLVTTSVLAEVAGVDFELALTTGFVVAIAAHFMLQRKFVWVHSEGFAVSLRHQALRYLVVAGAQYGFTVAATSVVPSVLHVPTEIVYLCVATGLTAVNFIIFRARVFHPAEPSA
jgi:putative flippase GtrA